MRQNFVPKVHLENREKQIIFMVCDPMTCGVARTTSNPIARPALTNSFSHCASMRSGMENYNIETGSELGVKQLTDASKFPTTSHFGTGAGQCGLDKKEGCADDFFFLGVYE